MILHFDKYYKNEDYELLFNTKTGVEVLKGVGDKQDPFILNMPSLLDVGVMGTCKHKCEFCYQGHHDRPNMTLTDFMSIVDEASYHVNQIALGGHGDPNHHPNFKEIVEYCRSKNVVPNYTTSGIGLTDEQIEISKMCGAVAVSDYEKPYTYEAIQKFINADIKTNIHQILSAQTYTKCLGIVEGEEPDHWDFDVSRLNAVIFLLFKPQGAGTKLRHLIPNKSIMEHFSKFVFKPRSRFKIGMDSCLINHMLRYGEPSVIQRMSIDTCEASRMSAYITPDMKFMPCSFANHDTGIQIKEKGDLHKIWKGGATFKTFRKLLEKNKKLCPLNL
jgi:MoaA/NifB/PqqE/SkfB family radical SAM enzyme